MSFLRKTGNNSPIHQVDSHGRRPKMLIMPPNSARLHGGRWG